MNAEQLARFPVHPPSVAEWEDLLVRVEIMPRALKANLEELPAGQTDTEEVLRELVSRETLIGRWLEEAVSGRGPEERLVAGEFPLRSAELADRFAGERARNFAMVQRRGVEIWGWSAETESGYRPTVYQVLGWLARADADALVRIRAATCRAGSGEGAAC